MVMLPHLGVIRQGQDLLQKPPRLLLRATPEIHHDQLKEQSTLGLLSSPHFTPTPLRDQRHPPEALRGIPFDGQKADIMSAT